MYLFTVELFTGSVRLTMRVVAENALEAIRLAVDGHGEYTYEDVSEVRCDGKIDVVQRI